MKWQTKLSTMQVTAVKKTNAEKSIDKLKTSRLKKYELLIFLDAVDHRNSAIL